MIFSALSGLLLALAFPKFSIAWLAWVALVPFLIALRQTARPAEAAANALVFGLFFFGFNLFWVTSLYRFAGWWAVVGWLALVIFQSIFIVVFALLARNYNFSVWAASIFWVALEWLRAWGPFGVTAGGLGYSQANFLPLIQLASWTSVYGVTLLIFLFNISLADLLTKPVTRRRGFVFAGIVILLFAVYFYGRAELLGNRRINFAVSKQVLKVAIIQPNVDQFDRMDPRKIFTVFSLHEELTRQAKGAELIIWPETAIFTYLLQDQSAFLRLQALAQETNAWLVFGTPFYDGKNSYNSIAVISPAGEVTSRYDKGHLVPFGEYLPFRPLLYQWLKYTGYFNGEFSPAVRANQLVIAGQKVGGAVCFESTFPDLMRQRAMGSKFLLTVTNDAWFGSSAAAYQHLDSGVFRAVENRQYFIQAANTGFSALIDPYGRIVEKSELNRQQILTFKIPLS